MAKTTIGWTDFTINFWTGCKKVSAGCKYCYMYRDKERYGKDPTQVIRTSQTTIDKILAQAEQERIWRLRNGDNTPVKIFTCSWSDFFIEEADQWRVWAWDIIRKHPQFVWQILTKRTERFENPIERYKCFPYGYEDMPGNIWIGASIEDETAKYFRLYGLSQLCLARKTLTTPTRQRKFKLFISAEPLLGYIDFLTDDVNSSYIFENYIDWVIIGGESGNETGKYRYRKCDMDWMEKIVEDCTECGIPVFVKQMGTYIAKEYSLKDRHGKDISEFPKELQIQEFPHI